MRNLVAPHRKTDLEEFVWEVVFPYPEVRDHPFYRRLISFVIDHRAPLYYEQSCPSEHLGFSMMHNACLLRDYPDEPLRRMLFLLHDHTHILFPVHHNTVGVSAAEFTKVFTVQERAASNETEILVHYRLPGLRDEVFPGERLFVDVLREREVDQMSAGALLDLRRDLVENDEVLASWTAGAQDETVRAWFRRWRSSLPAWCARRHRELAMFPVPAFRHRWLTVSGYEQVISAYDLDDRPGQAHHARLRDQNLMMAAALTRAPEATVDALEGRVFYRS